MNNTQAFLLFFGIINLSLVIFCRPLSTLILRLFAYSRRVNPPEELEQKATKLGFQGAFSNPVMSNPTRKQAVIFLIGTGVINFLGCITFYLISIGLFQDSVTDENLNKSSKDSTTRQYLVKPIQ
jgi:hypothetical protein